ncbi:DMT family transporter [Vibrio sp. WXL103]|uniref:DMT family transporter n=1 Tax=Vibrio sp. WXL103 TaxID=3450710 RepID=UPI003EC88DD8
MHYLALAMAAVFWGGNYVVGKVMAQALDPVGITLIRWLGAACLIFLIYRTSVIKDWRAFKAHLPFNLIYSILGQIFFPLSLYFALQYTTSLNAAIYISTTPSMVLAINYFVFKDKVHANEILGVIVSTAGVIYLSVMNAKAESFTFNIGDGLAFFSAFSWSLYSSLLRFKQKDISNTSFVAYTSGIAALILVPIFGLYTSSTSFNINQAMDSLNYFSVAGLCYLIIFPSWLSYVFWNYGAGKVGTSKSDIFTHLIPISGGCFGVFFLGERLESYHFIAIILIASGVALCARKQRRNLKTQVSDNL